MADLTELQIVTAFRSRARIACPAVAIVGIPNAAKRGQWAVRQAKREGMAAGAPDMILLADGGLIAWIEWKSAKGVLSGNQREWIERLQRMGFPAGVFHDADTALAWLRSLGFPFLFDDKRA